MPTHYFGTQALLDSIESGAIAPVRGSWLLREWKKGGGKLKQRHDGASIASVEEIGQARVRRRQELPPEAFWSVQDVRKLLEQLGEAEITTTNGHVVDYGLLFVALSYRWLSSEHPDPDGFHLAQVASVLQLYLEPGEHISRSFRYSLIHCSPLAQMFKYKQLNGPVDCLVFWECVPSPIHPREPLLPPSAAQPQAALSLSLSLSVSLSTLSTFALAASAASTRTRSEASARQ